MNDGLRLLESEQMDCRRAGVVQTTLWALMSVVASMAPMASMVASMAPMVSMVVASMAPMVASMASMDLVASMASIVTAPMEPMVSLIWMDLKAPEIKSEREEVQRFGAHLLHPALCIKPFGLLLVRGPHGTVLLMSLHPDATPRESVRTRSLRRVVNIDGVRADGSCKIGDERVEGLWRKVMMEKLRKNW